jgi:hypothetical protein
VRSPGDICPGVGVVPDGDPVSIDTRRFFTTADYGTTCGYNGTGGLGWVDGVARFTLNEARDVTVIADGDGTQEVNVEITRVCGAPSFVIPGCDTGLPAQRTVRNLAAGTYWATIDYRPMGRPDHTLSVRVTTAPPTPPGPASRCPGIVLGQGTPVAVDVDTLTAGQMLSCLPRQRFSAFLNFTAPEMPSDVFINVVSPSARNNAALALRAPCDGDMIDGCIGPGERAAPSVWRRYRNLSPGRNYTVQAATDAVGGQLSVRRIHVTPAVTERVTGNLTCMATHTIPAGGGVFTGTTEGATAVATPSCATAMTGCLGARGVLYRLDLATRSRVVASMEGEGFDTLLAVQPGDTCPGRASMFSGACNDDWYGTNSAVDATLNAGRYWVFAGGCGATQSGNYQLDVAVLPP